MLVRLVYQIGVSLSRRSVVHTWNVVVPESVDAVLRDEVLVQRDEVVPSERLAEIRSLPVPEELSLEMPEHGARLAGRFVSQVVCELGVRVRVDGIQDHRDAAAVRGVYEALKRQRPAEALVGREVVERV